jgi:hypothetical protein
MYPFRKPLDEFIHWSEPHQVFMICYFSSLMA